MGEKGLGDKRKTIIYIVIVVLVVVALILSLIYFTNLFNSDEKSVAQIRKAEKKLEQIEIPEVEFIEEKEEIVEKKEEVPSSEEVSNAPGPPAPPSVPNMGDYENIAHSIYPAFAKAYNLSIDKGILVASDDIIYETGYYSVNGSAWTEFTLQGDGYEDYPWLLNYGRINLPSELNGDGTHYIIIFSCSLNNDTWNCHGDIEDSVYVPKWQLRIVENEAEVINLSEPISPENVYDICNEDSCYGGDFSIIGNLTRMGFEFGNFTLVGSDDEKLVFASLENAGMSFEEIMVFHDEFKLAKLGVVEVKLDASNLRLECEFTPNSNCTWVLNIDIDPESVEFIREVECQNKDYLINNNFSSMACFNDSTINLTGAYEILLDSSICTDEGRTISSFLAYVPIDNFWTFSIDSNYSSIWCSEYCYLYEDKIVFERTGHGDDLILEEEF